MHYGIDPEKLYRANDPALKVIASANLLAKWRHAKRGPSFHKAGGRVLYSGRDLIDWLDATRVETSKAA